MSHDTFLALVALLLASTSPATLACTVSATPVAFGSIDPVARVPADSTGTLQVTCPTETTYTLSIAGGNGTVDSRYMTRGSDMLRYQLYTEANLSVVWGDGTAGTVTVTGTAGSGSGTSHIVYGRVPAQPLAKAGAYSDTLTVTVTY